MVDNGPGFKTTPGCVALVTGSSGFCGARMVEMLLERGAKTVIGMDLVPPNETLQKRFAVAEEKSEGNLIVLSGKESGDLTNPEAVERAFQKAPQIDVVYHIAALVGPFHDHDLYFQVNVLGTRHVLDCCKKYKVPKLVNSSSPSTRFHGPDIEGLREEELTFPQTFLARYAETKAQAEQEVSAACSDDLMTVSIAPHQVYGPYDGLFFPKIMETAGNGRLRIFGGGQNLISVCYVDNYCHGLLCGADQLKPQSPILGKFYIVTDGPPVKFWGILNQAAVAMGFADMEKKFHLSTTLLYTIAYFCNFLGYLLGKKFKLNPFNVRMMTIHRYFSIENAKRDFDYKPVKEFDEAWQFTIDWFKENWLPGFLEESGIKTKQS